MEIIETFKLLEKMELPKNVLQNLMSFMDWESRLNLNLALPFEKRIPTKFSTNSDSHDIRVLMNSIHLLMAIFEEKTNKTEKAVILMGIMKKFKNPRYILLAAMYHTFRNRLIDRILEYSNYAYICRMGVNASVARNLVKVCKEVFVKIYDLKSIASVKPGLIVV